MPDTYQDSPSQGQIPQGLAAQKPGKVSIIPQELKILDESIGRLDSTVETLTHKLMPILNMSETPSNVKEGTDVALPELAGAIRGERVRVQKITDILIDLMTRIEI